MHIEDPELRAAMEVAKALHKHSRRSMQVGAQLRDSAQRDPEAARRLIDDLRRQAFAAAYRLTNVQKAHGKPTAQPEEARQDDRKIA